MTAYIYPTHPCGNGQQNWLEVEVRDAWKASCRPYFSLPFLWTSPSELNPARTPYDRPFWLYFYYSEKTIHESCPEKASRSKTIEYRARVVEYNDVNTNPNPFNTPNTFVIPSHDITDVKIWFRCDRFEEVRVTTTLNNTEPLSAQCRPLRLSDFDYAGTSYIQAQGLALQRVCPWRRIAPIVVTQTTWYEVED